jgi:hypothetical protein
MQTREMKREYEVAVLDPAGNVTAIVLSDVLAAEKLVLMTDVRASRHSCCACRSCALNRPLF